MELDGVSIIAGLVNISLGVGVGINVGSFQKTIRKLSKDPLRHDLYEESLKNVKNIGPMEFLDYYIGMPGRHLAYKIFDNPNFWQ
jgi:hypothetical protein